MFAIQSAHGQTAPPADPAKFCGPNPYDGAKTIEDLKKLIPSNGTYDLNSPNWPSVKLEAGKLVVDVPKGSSMCTIASAAGTFTTIANILNSGNLMLTPDIAEFISKKGKTDSFFHFGMNGNTFAPAALVKLLGGEILVSDSPAKNKEILLKVKPGDQCSYGRGKGGHATIFEKVEGDSYCFYSSQERTNGFGRACTPIGELTDLACSQIPRNPEVLLANIKALMKKEAPPAEPAANKSEGLSRKLSEIGGAISTAVSGAVTWIKGLFGKLSSQSAANAVKKDDIKPLAANDFPQCPLPNGLAQQPSLVRTARR